MDLHRSMNWKPGICFVLLMGALAGCRREPAPTPAPQLTDTPGYTSTFAPTTLPPTNTSAPPTETVYPPPAPTQPSPLISPYPYPSPGGLPPTSYPAPSPQLPSGYPGPATPFPSPTSPYPAPSTLFPSPTSPYPVPPGGTSATTVTQPILQPTVRPEYPGPGATAPAPSPTGTGVPAPQVPTFTPGVLRSRLQATDPRTFQIVSGQTQLVMFFAYWSPESSSMAPVVTVLESRYKDRIRFVYLDIEDPGNSLFKALSKDRLLPLIFILDAQGNVLKEWQGIVPGEEIDRALSTAG